MSGAMALVPLYGLDLAELAALADDATRAEAAATMLSAVAATTMNPAHTAAGTLAAAWAALAGSSSDAAVLARQAISVLDGLELPLLQGRAYDLLGRALASEDAAGAADSFREAVARFESCGAVWRRDRALGELDKGRPAGS